jgi:hypothetical protein
MSLQNIQQKKLETKNNFEGVPIFAAGGIHEKAFGLLNKEKINKDDPILILGSGAGAFDKRLISNGYSNITSVEFVEGVHMVNGVKLLNRDLNKDFTDIGRFKAIVALEIIEHLENQFHFIRQISQMFVDKDSFLILSTPNIESDFSRLKYFVFGRLHFFGPEELVGTGHINPIFENILKFNLSLSNLQIIKTESNHSIWKDLFEYGNLLIRFFYFIFYINN